MFAAINSASVPDGDNATNPKRDYVEPHIKRGERYNEGKQAMKGKRYDEAFEIFTKEAARGNVFAEYELGDMYRRKLIKGKNKSKEHYQRALDGFRAVEPNCGKLQPYIQYRIGRMYYDGYGMYHPDYTEAFRWLEKAALAGNHYSAKKVGDMYRDGAGTLRSLPCAVEWYKRAARGGNVYAILPLAKIYLDKEGGFYDVQEAYSLMKTAAKKKEVKPYAEYEIAEMLRNELVKDDVPEPHYIMAFNGFIKAEQEANENDDPDSSLQYKIGKMLYNGYGVAQNYVEAFNWFVKADSNGNALAAKKIGDMYRDGNGVQQDSFKAVAWYQKAVAANNPYAMIALAKMYLKDEYADIPKDLPTAIPLLEKSRKDEDAAQFADYTLGAMYMFDKDVKDEALAMKYLTLSAEAGNEFAEALIKNAEEWKEQQLCNIIQSTFSVLNNICQSDNSDFHALSLRVFGRGDLSKEQIAELIYQLSDKQNTAEM